jgi:hypothetical protein
MLSLALCVVVASKNATSQDEALRRVRELEEKLKSQEQKHKDALAAVEVKVQELHTQASKREDLLVARLHGMVEQLTSKDQLLRPSPNGLYAG